MVEEQQNELELLIQQVLDDDEALDVDVLKNMDSTLLAQFLEGLPVEHRVAIWRRIEPDQQPDILWEMHSDSRQLLFANLEEAEISVVFSSLDSDYLVELYDDFPAALQSAAVAALDSRQRRYFEAAQSYEEQQVGRVVDRDVLTLPANSRVRDAALLLKRKRSAEYSYCVYLLDRAGHYVGAARFADLLRASANDLITECIDPEIIPVDALLDIEEAVVLVEQALVLALPVVDGGRLIGQVSIQEVYDVKQEQFETQIMVQAGLGEGEDLFAPVGRSAQRRATWLGINLLTALLASWTIGLFAETLEQVVALAVLMPIVASMGGIAGSQTLTLMIRGMAVGQISNASLKPLSVKELKVALLNALLWSAVIGVVAVLWFADVKIGLVIMLAVIINMLCAAYAGVWVPVLLDRLNLDPALSGSVILTTVTDVVGFVAFLGLGSWILL
jgi:magnesium transporter